MIANRTLRVILTRGGPAPALLADPERIDHVEVVDVDSGEVILFWDCAPGDASRLARRLREDLAGLSREDFLKLWSDESAASDV